MKDKISIGIKNLDNEGIIKVKGIYNSEEDALTAVNSKLDSIKSAMASILNQKILLECSLSNKVSLDTILSYDEVIKFFNERNSIEGIKYNYYTQEKIDANIQLSPYAEQIGSTKKYMGAIKVNYTGDDEFKSLTEKSICVLNSVNKLEELSKC